MCDQPDSLKIAEAVAEATAVLRGSGVMRAQADARTLLTHTLARDLAFLLTHSDKEIEPLQLALFRERVARRAAGEPVQYVTGRQEFYGLDFEVTPAVLIPRPETELLVETALELLRETPAPLLCDVGTGSGCVAVALLRERADARAIALDISPAALEVAARNAASHAVGERLTFLVSDCFDALEPCPHAFTLLVSNPPYVNEHDIPHLQREVRDHEPHVALTPGGDGLNVIRRLLSDAPRFLIPGGHLLFEIGYDQHEAVATLIDPNIWTMLDTRRDLHSIPRTVVLRRA